MLARAAVSVSIRGCGRGNPPNMALPPALPCCLHRTFPSIVVSHLPTRSQIWHQRSWSFIRDTALAHGGCSSCRRSGRSNALFALAVVESLGNDPHFHNARLLPHWELLDLLCLDVQPNSDTVRRGYMSMSLPSYPHFIKCLASDGRPPQLVSCLLCKNPAHQQHSACRLSEQADGTAISSLSPALSHHHMHGSQVP